MNAPPAAKTHARLSCVQRGKSCFSSRSLAVCKRVWNRYIVLLYTRWFTRSLIFYLFIRTGEVCHASHNIVIFLLVFLAEGRTTARLFFLRSRLPVAAIRRVSHRNLGAEIPDRTLTNTLYAYTRDNAVLTSLCETQTHTIRSTSGNHSDADGGDA